MKTRVSGVAAEDCGAAWLEPAMYLALRSSEGHLDLHLGIGCCFECIMTADGRTQQLQVNGNRMHHDCCRKRELHEARVAALAVRSVPLGQDRHFRRYW